MRGVHDGPMLQRRSRVHNGPTWMLARTGVNGLLVEIYISNVI